MFHHPQKMSEGSMSKTSRKSRYDYDNSFTPRYAPSPPMSPFDNDEFITSRIQKEECVKCGEETKYNKSDHVDKRVGYIDGAGQLCNNCFIQGFQCG